MIDMDAVEFLKEYSRMCKYYRQCKECPLEGKCLNVEPEKQVNAVEQWSQSHPQKTIMQDFFEKFPNAPRTKTGEPMMCPYNCGYGNFCCEQANGTCYNCWNRPLED